MVFSFVLTEHILVCSDVWLQVVRCVCTSFVATGVKAFSCSVCSTAFTTNGSLTRHMATHVSTKPYRCPFCEQGFRTTMHCKKHMKTHQTAASGGSAPGDADGGGEAPWLIQVY